MLWSFLASAAALLPSLASAQHVYAHIVLGEANYEYTQALWEADIRLAASYGIEGFALNFGPPYQGNSTGQIPLAFAAANAVIKSGDYPNFRLFFSFDYNNNNWTVQNLTATLNDWGSNKAHLQINNKTFASTFEGSKSYQQNDWATVRSSRQGNLYFVPDWTAAGPYNTTFNRTLVDGAFSWDIWPIGPANVNTTDNQNWVNFTRPYNKSFMMGVSPWFHVDYPPYGETWLFKGDRMWNLLWNQTTQLLPDFVEIVSWNDFGESHYVGPLRFENELYPEVDRYVNNRPHTGWLETLPYQIAAYKHAYNSTAYPAPTVAKGKDKVVYWYRSHPILQGSGTTDVRGDPPYLPQYNVTDMLEDKVFAIVLAAQAGVANISIGGNVTSLPVKAGLTFVERPYGGNYGNVSVALSGTSVNGTGIAIAQLGNGTANYNAWVGCAGACATS